METALQTKNNFHGFDRPKLPPTWGFIQVGLDKLIISQLQSQALVQAGQTWLSIWS